MTKFRGCIDIHSGKVKQLVGGTITKDDCDTSDRNATENFVSSRPSSYYAELYKSRNVKGCHVIKLGTNPENDEAAKAACTTWPYNLQVGGGIQPHNALEWLEKHKASHVILTSWLFTDRNGKMEFDWEKLAQISELVGKSRLVVDTSCREIHREGKIAWIVAMNKWQTLTNSEVNAKFIEKITQYCDEILIHAADVEGLCGGINERLVVKLGEWCPKGFEEKIVYAGGAKLIEDLGKVKQLSQGKVDLTYGSSLDIFGGNLVRFEDVCKWNQLD